MNRNTETASVARKLVLTLLTGGVVFLASSFLDGQYQISLSDQLLLTILVGGIALLVQFLTDFERRIYFSEEAMESRSRVLREEQEAAIEESRAVMESGLQRISEATRLFQLVETSALQTESLTQLVQRSSLIDKGSAELVRDLAQYEIGRVSSLLKSLSAGDEIFYDGEDREWLLGLTISARASIAAISLASAGSERADVGSEITSNAGPWMNDLGGRFLEVQRAAVRRGVQIRRIFIFERPGIAEDGQFSRIVRLHQEAGVQVRLLNVTSTPEYLRRVITDFIVFDDVIGYETVPAIRMTSGSIPAIVTTRLILQLERVQRAQERFEELWVVAAAPANLPEPDH